MDQIEEIAAAEAETDVIVLRLLSDDLTEIDIQSFDRPRAVRRLRELMKSLSIEGESYFVHLARECPGMRGPFWHPDACPHCQDEFRERVDLAIRRGDL